MTVSLSIYPGKENISQILPILPGHSRTMSSEMYVGHSSLDTKFCCLGQQCFLEPIRAGRSPGLECCSINGGSGRVGAGRVLEAEGHHDHLTVSPSGPISEWYTVGISTPFYSTAVCFKGRMTGVLPLLWHTFSYS